MDRKVAVGAIVLLAFMGAVPCVGQVWVHRLEVAGEECPCWFSEDKKQDARCWTSPPCSHGDLQHGLLGLDCEDDETWPDRIGILLKVTVESLSTWREKIAEELFEGEATPDLLDHLANLGCLGLYVQVVDPKNGSPLPLRGMIIEGQNRAGGWSFSEWAPKFVLSPQVALLVLPPGTREIAWSVVASVYAFENRTGTGYGHQARLCFRSSLK